MDRKDKIQKILDAYKSGMSKKNIDPKGNGSSLNTLLGGGNPTQRKVDEMYINVLCRKEVIDVKELKLSLAPSESLTQNEKQELLIKATKAGIKKSKINPKTNGGSLTRLMQGKTLWPSVVDRLYENLLKILDYNLSKEDFREQKTKSLESIVISLMGQVQDLQSQVESIQSQLKSLNHIPKPNEKTTRKICGLPLLQKEDRVKGYKYKRWYAAYKHNGKRHLIYIGKDLSKAKERIEKGIARLKAKS